MLKFTFLKQREDERVYKQTGKIAFIIERGEL